MNDRGTVGRPSSLNESWHVLCSSSDLREGGATVAFDVCFMGQTMRAFAVRFNGSVFAYLNRCSHVAMELDWQPNRIFDESGSWLVCATHGALYAPSTGACVAGPCRGGLVPIGLREQAGTVQWLASEQLHPVFF